MRSTLWFFQTSKHIHDKLLDKRGQFGTAHRCFSLPFDKKLRKKKKYREAKNLLKENPEGDKILLQNLLPLFEEEFHHASQKLKNSYRTMCKIGSAPWRDPKHDAGLRCRFHHMNDPYNKLGPFKLEEINRLPFVGIFHGFMYESEMAAFKEYASPKLIRSETGSLGTFNTGLIRTSKQAWMPDRFFNFHSKMGNISYVLAKSEGEPPPIPYDPAKYLNVTNAAGYKISQRIQNATELNLWKPFASESFQVRYSTSCAATTVGCVICAAFLPNK